MIAHAWPISIVRTLVLIFTALLFFISTPFAQFAQQGPKLVGTGAVGQSVQGSSVVLSGDGNNAMMGGHEDNSYTGATWAFTRSNGVWTQQGDKLVGTGAVVGTYGAEQGSAVALSADGNTAIIGGPTDNPDGSSNGVGAAWVFVQSASPSLQVAPTTNMAASGSPGGPFIAPSFQYQVSATVSSINYSISEYPKWLTPF